MGLWSMSGGKVPVNYPLAVGHQLPVEVAPKLEQELGPDQMAQARQRAGECKAKEFKGCQ